MVSLAVVVAVAVTDAGAGAAAAMEAAATGVVAEAPDFFVPFLSFTCCIQILV